MRTRSLSSLQRCLFFLTETERTASAVQVAGYWARQATSPCGHVQCTNRVSTPRPAPPLPRLPPPPASVTLRRGVAPSCICAQTGAVEASHTLVQGAVLPCLSGWTSGVEDACMPPAFHLYPKIARSGGAPPTTLVHPAKVIPPDSLAPAARLKEPLDGQSDCNAVHQAPHNRSS